MNWFNGSGSGLYAAAYRMTRDHLLRVRLSALARMMDAKGSSRSDTSSRGDGYRIGVYRELFAKLNG
jgi:hypothetical protein